MTRNDAARYGDAPLPNGPSSTHEFKPLWSPNIQRSVVSGKLVPVDRKQQRETARKLNLGWYV